MKKNKVLKIILGLAICFYFFMLIFTSWISDDAYITFRTVDNFLNGFGLRWNVIERVQSYTHPLWMFCILGITFFIKNIYLGTTILSFIFSLLTIYLIVLKVSHSKLNGIVTVFALGFSKAFIDYSTSGLENPLSYFLITLFFICFLKYNKLEIKQICKLSFIASLIMLNRLDLSLILFPSFLYFLFLLQKNKKLFKGMLFILAGFTPLIIWELFSVIYYGFPFPNTAYAKLGVFIPLKDLVKQGFFYFRNSILWDPLTLFVIFSGIIVTFTMKNKKKQLIAIGILLYLFYVLKIGGDFMTGRFFAVPFLCSLLIISGENFSKKTVYIFSFFVFVFGFYQIFHTFNVNAKNFHKFDHGIADERLYYFEGSGLIPCSKRGFSPVHKRITAGKKVKELGLKVVTKGAVGMFGYYAGADIYVVDKYGLCDPLLARIPKMEYYWRIGHLVHLPPAGYYNTLETGKNCIFDSNLNLYYEKLSKVVRGQIFSTNRFKTIVQFNFNKFNSLVENYSKNKTVVPLNFTNKITASYENWDGQEVIHFTTLGLAIDFGKVLFPKKIKLVIDKFNNYTMYFIKNEKIILKTTVPTGGFITKDMAHIEFSVPKQIVEGFDSILIKPSTALGANSLGYFVALDKFGNSLPGTLNKKVIEIIPSITHKMRQAVLKVTGNKDFVFLNSGKVSIISKEKEKQLKNNCLFLKKANENNVKFVVMKKSKLYYFQWETLLKSISKGNCILKEDNLGFTVFEIVHNSFANTITTDTQANNIFNWTVQSEGKVIVYPNKKKKGRSVLFYSKEGMVTGVTKQKSSFITFFGNKKTWNENAGYIHVSKGAISIVIIGESLTAPFNVFPFVVFYDKQGRRIKTELAVNIKFSTYGEYKLYFKKNKNGFAVPYLSVPDNAYSMGLGFNFYKDKGFLNVKQVDIFQN